MYIDLPLPIVISNDVKLSSIVTFSTVMYPEPPPPFSPPPPPPIRNKCMKNPQVRWADVSRVMLMEVVNFLMMR